MRGVYLAEQLKESYQIDRRSKKWWHRIFFHLLDVSVVNSFLLASLVVVVVETAVDRGYLVSPLSEPLFTSCPLQPLLLRLFTFNSI